MRRSHKRSPELPLITTPSKTTWLCVACVSLVTFGCVTSSTHNEVVAERDRLALESAAVGDLAGKLEVSNASLEAERVRIYDELEDLRIERESLTQTRTQLEDDVSRLSENESELNEQLQETSAALTAATADVRDLQSTYQGLVTDLESELQKGAIEIEQLRSGLRVAVSDEILFRSGSAKLDKDGAALLEKVAANVSRLDYSIDVEGHTDNIPIRGSLTKQYPTNWELAGARASSVVRLFERVGIDGTRLQAISRAEFAPVAANDTAESRSINRRIEIRLRPRENSDVKADAVETAETLDGGAEPKAKATDGEASADATPVAQAEPVASTQEAAAANDAVAPDPEVLN